ncbi:MAG: NlpC/P60 family protein [Miltoncostaeaceae bacterium]
MFLRPLIAAGLALVVAGSLATAAPMTRNDALAQAKRGKTAQQIVREAFPGSQLTQLPQQTVRILVADQARQVVMQGKTVLRLVDEGRRGAKGRRVAVGHRILIKRFGKTGFAVTDLDVPGAKSLKFIGPVRLDSGSAETGIRMSDPLELRYRGSLRVVTSSARTMAVINQTSTENYIKGVLPGDMPPEWGDTGKEALVAGAVAARSRALHLKASAGGTCHAPADDPLYLGIDGERPQTNAAIEQSRGWALVLAGRPLEAEFPVVPGDVVVFQPEAGKPSQVAFAKNTVVPGSKPGLGGQAVQLAMSYLSTPYLWGGSKPGGFDCSGLTYWVFGQLGMRIPRVAEDQATVGAYVPFGQLKPGDTVFFADSSGYIGHMGLYIGGGQMVHAPQTGDVVKVTDISSGRYFERFAGGRRYSP